MHFPPLSFTNTHPYQSTLRHIRHSTASLRHSPSSTLFLVRDPTLFSKRVALIAPQVLGFLLFLLFLAWRHHSHGQRSVWITPVTSFPWFYSSQDAVNEKEAKLPPPVTAPVDRSRSKGAGALNVPKDEQQKRARPQDLGKIRTTALTPPPKTRQPSYEYKHGYWLPKSTDAPSGPPPPPPKATVSRSNTRDRQPSRDQSRESGRSHERGRSHRSTRDRSLTRGNSGSKRPAAGYPPTRDRYFRDASPRR